MEKFHEEAESQVSVRQDEKTATAQKTKNQYKINQLLFVWGWLAIPIIAWIVFYWYLNFSSFVGAFQDPLTDKFSLINFKNIWKEITAGDTNLGSLAVGFENTLKYFLLELFVKYPIQLVCCYFLYKQIKGYKAYRFIFYLPAILPGVALSSVFKEVVAGNGILAQLGFAIPKTGLLGSYLTATDTIIAYSVWLCVCGNMLLLCGAMNRIPVEVLEAARLDGVKPAKEFIYLILPMIWPTLSTLLILTCCGFLNSSGPILLLAPDSYSLRTTTISYWIFEKVYANGSHGTGQYNLVSAAGMLLSAVAVPCVLLIRKLLDLVPSVEY
jgi:ABC-type sugar transport system permease subunit